MNKQDYPDLFYRYAFSGKASCHACKKKVRNGQFVFVFEGNIYHDICSRKLKGRIKLKEGDPK